MRYEVFAAVLGREHESEKSNRTAPTCMDPLLTKKEVAKRLNTSMRSVDNLIARKMIGYIKIGKSVRFEKSSVLAFRDSRRVAAKF